MRSKTTLATLLLFVAASLPAAASHPASVPSDTDANAPSAITADFKCRVEEVGEDSTLVLVDVDTESRHVVQLDDTVRIRARSKKDFDGRKKLGLADLQPGQTIKVTVYVADGSIRAITVLEKA
jgi:hypothetical protein